MARAKDEVKVEAARIRYVVEGWDIDAIAEEAQVAGRTVRTWRKQGEWEEEKRNYIKEQASDNARLERIYSNALKVTEERAKGGEDPPKWAMEIIKMLAPKPKQAEPVKEEKDEVKDPLAYAKVMFDVLEGKRESEK